MLKLEQSTFDDRCQAPQEVTDLIQATQTDVGTERLQKHLNQLPFPHFEAHPDDPELLIRIDESGQRTAGRFVDRKFVAVQP